MKTDEIKLLYLHAPCTVEASTHVRRSTHVHCHHTGSGCASSSSLHTSVGAKMIKQTPPLCTAALIKLSCMCPLRKKQRKVPLVVPTFTFPVKTSLLSELFLLSHMETKFIRPLLSIQGFFFFKQNECDYLCEK